MSAPRRGRGPRGLTLIELLLTVTILAVAGAIVAEAFGTALGAWRRSFGQGREELAARIVAARVAGQLRSAVVTFTERGEGDAIAFEVGDALLRFVTTQSSRSPAPAAVSYRIVEHEGRPALAYREHAWPDKTFFDDPPAQREEIVPEVTGLAVSVEPREDARAGRGRPRGEWRPEEGILPGTVALTVTTAAPGGGEARTTTVTVALAAEGAEGW